MSETATLTHNADPTLQMGMAMPYETERGLAFRPLDISTGEALTPPDGIGVEIYDEWAAEEVSNELADFDTFLSGSETVDGEQPQTVRGAVGKLSNLSLLHLDHGRVMALEAHVQAEASEDWMWPKGQVADKVAEQQVEVLPHAMEANEPLAHAVMLDATPLLRSGALKPKAGHDEYRSLSGDNYLLKAQGANAVKDKVAEMVNARDVQRKNNDDENLRYTGYPSQMGLHSQLVHFSEVEELRTHTGTSLFYPRGAVMERTPIVMMGQDAKGSTGLAGIKNGGDEAHHTHNATSMRDRFARVHFELSGQVEQALTDRPHSRDVTFMADTQDAARAVDFEYPLEDAVLFVDAYALRRYAEQFSAEDTEDVVFPKSVREVCAVGYGDKKDDLDLDKFANKATKFKVRMESDNPPQFKSPQSEAFWKDIFGRMSTIEEGMIASGTPPKEGYLKSDYNLIAMTALAQRLFIAAGHDAEWANNAVFMPAKSHILDAYDEFAKQKATERIHRAGPGVSFVQARTEKLEFDQLDLMTQLPVYKN